MTNLVYICVCFLGTSLFSFVLTAKIDVPHCNPPDLPEFGNYGPKEDIYMAGDSIHYYCDTDTYIGGNFYRRCEDNGDWTGETPVCDPPAEFSFVNQSSTARPLEENDAELAADGLRDTCSSTKRGNGQQWMGVLKDSGEMIRVMVYMPVGDVAYEVLLLKANGESLSCGTKVGRNDRLTWEFHNCPGPHNHGAVAVQIKSLSSIALQLCEVVVHVLTPPTCVDPHLKIDNGYIQLTRKTASLLCDRGYSKSPITRIECIRTGVWERKSLYCMEKRWEVPNAGAPEANDVDP